MAVQEDSLHRKRAYEASTYPDAEQARSTKRQKQRSVNLPSHVWDELSKVTLTRKALQEFDRRTKERVSTVAETAPWTRRRLLRSDTRRLEERAKQGGPDLSRLRGYADLSTKHTMSSKSSRPSKRDRDSGFGGSNFSGRTSTTGPYNPQFEQILIDNRVYPDGYSPRDGDEPPEPRNIDEIRQRLSQSRPSLSPSAFPNEAFKTFRNDNRCVGSEQEVVMRVMPTILGSGDRAHHSSGNVEFSNMERFHPDLTTPKPDLYYGSQASHIDARVRADLGRYIVPSSSDQRPAAPNHFFEVKGPSGRGDVLQRQATYAGAVGARAMHQLQNYGKQTPSYDGKAYSTTATYNAGEGSLRIYATHLQASATGSPEYHTTAIRSYAITDSLDTFRQGVAAYRNARDLSKDHRDRLVAGANAMAHTMPADTAMSSPLSQSTDARPSITDSSMGSDTSVDELAPDYEQHSKRPRKRRTKMRGNTRSPSLTTKPIQRTRIAPSSLLAASSAGSQPPAPSAMLKSQGFSSAATSMATPSGYARLSSGSTSTPMSAAEIATTLRANFEKLETNYTVDWRKEGNAIFGKLKHGGETYRIHLSGAERKLALPGSDIFLQFAFLGNDDISCQFRNGGKAERLILRKRNSDDEDDEDEDDNDEDGDDDDDDDEEEDGQEDNNNDEDEEDEDEEKERFAYFFDPNTVGAAK